MTIFIRKELKPIVILSPNNRKGLTIFRVIKFAGDKIPNLNRSDTTTHAGNQVIIKKKFAMTVIPENKLKICISNVQIYLLFFKYFNICQIVIFKYIPEAIYSSNIANN